MSEATPNPHVEDDSEHVAKEFSQPPVEGKVVDEVDNHQPMNPNPPKETDPDPSDGRNKLRPLYEMVEALANNIETLTGVVAGMVKDEKVSRTVPWTHRGSRNV
jgi:hypothetical protein